MKTRSSILSLLWFLLAGYAGAATMGPPVVAETTHLGLKVVAPANGMYTSAFPDFTDGQTTGIKEKVQAYDSLVRKPLAIVVMQNDFVDGFSFPAATVQAILELGKTPLIRMLPRSVRAQNKGQDPVYTMDAFLAGTFDSAIKAWADAAKATEKPLMVEFGPEVNGSWYPWNGKWNGGSETTAYGDPTLPDGPEKFRDTYRRIIKIFRAEGATNVTWVFHVDTQPIPDEPWNAMANYYPGDEYIDWIGASVFGAQLVGDWWGPFTETLDAKWYELSHVSLTRPIAVLECGVIEKVGDPQAKGQWIAGAMQAFLAKRYERLKLFNYWHERSWDGGVSDNFRVDTSPYSLQTFIKWIADPFFLSQTQTVNFN